MAVDKINSSMNSHQILNDRLKEAASGKKNSVHAMDAYRNQNVNNSEDKTIFSDDAKKLQETEVILRSALQKLNEMDEVRTEKLADIMDKINQDFYTDNPELDEELSDLIIPEDELRDIIQKRMNAEEYVDQIHQYDIGHEQIDEEKLKNIREKVAQGYYNKPEVLEKIANELVDLFE